MIIFIDIDHTLSDAFWRDEILADATKSWDDYHSDAHKDAPVMALVKMVRAIYAGGEEAWQIVGLTARPERFREKTTRWLVEHQIPLTGLLMRPENDFRPAHELKVALARDHLMPQLIENVPHIIVIDDREDVVMAFNALGAVGLQAFTRR
jgi:hypothetical protein